ncbi:hypothetical protein KG088_19265 [Halomonas sp. TRM85114]|uniref:hypothetical protein n=1 Tax=Halomonas jincaotanensis TaxID=2810616 RepID=UPI001BD4B318|nr:hypothetical protein [Halomonas jincaotanensis]MBS9405717.1 hypothetical protein [Halomonas jincaotanensis]
MITITTLQPIEAGRFCLDGLRIEMVPAWFEFYEKDIPALEILDAITDLTEDPGFASLVTFPEADSIEDKEEKAKRFMQRLIKKKPTEVQDQLQVLVARSSERARKAFFELTV